VTDVPAAVAVIVIAIAGGAVAAARVAVPAVVREVTVVATLAAVADAEDARNSYQFSVNVKGRSDAALFYFASADQNDNRLKMLSGICPTAVMT